MTQPLVTEELEYWDLPGLGTVPKYRAYKQGVRGNHYTPYAYLGEHGLGINAIYVPYWGSYFAPSSGHTSPYPHGTESEFTPTANKAYSRLLEKATGEQSQLGTFMAEWRESFGMVANRATGLVRAVRQLRKGNFRKFLRELSVEPKRKHRRLLRNTAEEASGLWLEYWFGWSPAISDIYNAVDQLQSPFPDVEPIRASAKQSTVSLGGPEIAFKHSGLVRIRTGARFVVTNPNLYLASQLGLVNPVSVVWEIIPFSFLVDWCFDVSSFISSFTDFAGVDVTDPWTSYISAGQWGQSMIGSPPEYGLSGKYALVDYGRQSRVLSLIRPTPNMQILANLGVSKTRAASSASLLVQMLKSL